MNITKINEQDNSDLIKSLSKKYNKSETIVRSVWNTAKELAKEKYDSEDEQIAYALRITHNILSGKSELPKDIQQEDTDDNFISLFNTYKQLINEFYIRDPETFNKHNWNFIWKSSSTRYNATAWGVARNLPIEVIFNVFYSGNKSLWPIHIKYIFEKFGITSYLEVNFSILNSAPGGQYRDSLYDKEVSETFAIEIGNLIVKMIKDWINQFKVDESLRSVLVLPLKGFSSSNYFTVLQKIQDIIDRETDYKKEVSFQEKVKSLYNTIPSINSNLLSREYLYINILKSQRKKFKF